MKITSTAQLASLISASVPKNAHSRHGHHGSSGHGRGGGGRGWHSLIHPATRVFQALRIVVNDEFARLRRALDAAVEVVSRGGVVMAISFHSGEDRIVKNCFKSLYKMPRHHCFIKVLLFHKIQKYGRIGLHGAQNYARCKSYSEERGGG